MSFVASIDNGLNSLADALGRLTERFNPILMKEVRQSLKSRQFLGTFLLMLLIAWIISLAAAIFNPAESASGRELLIGYLGVLSFCCGVVVPFTTYSSLSSERQQNTYELMQITLLKPSQIVWGKLWTALVQIGVYFSAITPFLGFTLLLEGVDVVILLAGLLQIFLFSMLLSMIGICQSSFNTKGVWRSLQTIGWLLFLLWMYFVILIGGVALEFLSFFFGSGTFLVPTSLLGWFGLSLLLSAVLIAYGLVFNLLRAVAVCQLTFPSDNRSTPIRRAVLPAIILWPILTMGINGLGDLEEWIAFQIILIGLGGYFFVTEVDQMSHRVLRDCQQRAFSFWALLIGLLAGVGVQFGLMRLSSWTSSAGYGSGPDVGESLAISGVAAWLVFTLFSYLLPNKRVVAIPYPLMPSGAAGFTLSMIATSTIPPVLAFHSSYMSPVNFYLTEQLYCVIIYLVLFLSTSYLIAWQIHYYLPNESPMVARFTPPLFFAIVLIIATVALQEYGHREMNGHILMAAVPFYLVERIRTGGINFNDTFLPFAALVLVTSITLICSSYLVVIHWLNYQVSKARVQGGTSATLTPTGETIHAS